MSIDTINYMPVVW